MWLLFEKEKKLKVITEMVKIFEVRSENKKVQHYLFADATWFDI